MNVLYDLVVATLALVAAIAGVFIAYLLLLLGAASWAKRAAGRRGDFALPTARAVVLVPAHNEELVLEATLQSLLLQNYPAERFEVVVIADNCTDRTAEIARASGATLLERHDTVQRGKGYALEWAIDRLLRRDADAADPVLAFAIIDADTQVDTEFLRTIVGRLFEGAQVLREHRRALQGRYGVLNVRDSWRAALMAAAFDLFNHIKPLGRGHLGMSVGLKGNGMAFTRAIFEMARWQGRSITEDIDFGLDLLQNHGIAVGYVPDAIVRAQMPTTAAQAASQRERWEGGRYRLIRDRGIPMLRLGLRRRDIRLIDAAMDLMTPPLAEIAALLALWFLLALAAYSLSPGRSLAWFAYPLAFSLGYAVYIVGGLRVSDAPREAYLALLRAPLYAPWKFALYASRLILRRRTAQTASEWVRTERAPLPMEGKSS